MFETFLMGQQQLREMALNAMLLAVDAQAAALKSMDREHSLGIENSFSVERLRERVKDLVQSAHAIVRSGSAAELAETREKIQSLATVARRVKADADRFKADSAPRAKFRYDHLLMQMGMVEPEPAVELAPTLNGSKADEAIAQTPPSEAPAGKAPTSTDVAHDPQKITAQAGFACLRAEIDEYEAFTMQVHATCNLALEYALNFAVETSRSASANV